MTKELTFLHPPMGHNAILGYDSVNDRWQAAYINASGQLVVNIGAGLADLLTELQQKLETADLALDADKHLAINQYQYDGSVWRKSNLLWGYNDNYLEEVSAENVAAGTWQLDGTNVPAGEVWVITALSGWCSTVNPTNIQFGIDRAGTRYFCKSEALEEAWKVYYVVGEYVMKAGDNAFVRFQSCVLNDDIYGNFMGYKMKVNM